MRLGVRVGSACNSVGAWYSQPPPGAGVIGRMISAAAIALRSDTSKIPSVFSMPAVTHRARVLFDEDFFFSLFAELSDADYNRGIGGSQESLRLFDLVGGEGEEESAGGLGIG